MDFFVVLLGKREELSELVNIRLKRTGNVSYRRGNGPGQPDVTSSSSSRLGGGSLRKVTRKSPAVKEVVIVATNKFYEVPRVTKPTIQASEAIQAEDLRLIAEI